MVAAVVVRYEDDAANPVATKTAVHITGSGADYVNEATNAINRFYLSAEHATYDAARSTEFEGDFLWDNWIAPTDGVWTFLLRQASDDAAVAQVQLTFDA